MSQKPVTTADKAKDYYEIRYDYNTVKGGTTIALPISFRATNRTTPGGSTIPITAELYDQNGSQLLSEVYTINNLTTSNWKGLSSEVKFYETYKSSAENTQSSADLAKLDSIPIEVKFSNFHYDMGVYLTEPRTLKLQVQLQANVVFDKDAEINKTWHYDETSRTLTKVVNTQDITIVSTIYRQYFAVKAPNFPYRKGTKIATFQLLEEDGSDLPNDGSKLKDIDFYLVPIIGYTYRLAIYNSVNINGSWAGTAIPYVPRNAEAEVEWQYEIYNASNSDDPEEKDSSDIKVENIYRNPINDHLYFTGVLINSQRSQFADESQKENLKTNILYAKTKDGQKVELARNIPVDQVYRFDEKVQQQGQTSYRELWLEFPKNINLHKPLKGNSDKIYVSFYEKVFPKDWQEAIKENPNYTLATTPLLNEYISDRVDVQHFWENEEKKTQGNAWNNSTPYAYRPVGGTVRVSNSVNNSGNYQLGQVVNYYANAYFDGLALEDDQGNPYDIKEQVSKR